MVQTGGHTAHKRVKSGNDPHAPSPHPTIRDGEMMRLGDQQNNRDLSPLIGAHNVHRRRVRTRRLSRPCQPHTFPRRLSAR